MSSALGFSGLIDGRHSKLYVEQEGTSTGPSILFVHGLGGTTNSYQSVVASLHEFNVIRFDWSGHGRSDLAPNTSIETYVDDCEDVIAHFGLKSIAVVGHSLGGLIAMHLGARRPDLISKLVLFGPVKAPNPTGQSGCKARAAAIRSSGGMAAVADAVIQNALSATTLRDRGEVVGFARELLSRQDAEGYALACLALGDAKDPQWSSIKAKLTVVSASEDKVSNPATCQSIVGTVENSELVTFDACGHWHMLEDPKACISVLKSSLS